MPKLPSDVANVVAGALDEDVDGGDLTASLIPAEVMARAYVVCRQDAVLCGCEWFNEAFKQLDTRVTVQWSLGDGETIDANTTLCHLQGPARALLSGERTALNFLQTLSATATQTRRFVDAVEGTGAKILDTRKTLPGLRSAQKYAVACAGGKNHRMGLYDGILIKENHIIAAGSITNAVQAAKAQRPDMAIEVEVEDLDELREAVEACTDIVLLDNFTLERMRKAVEFNNGRAKLEVSGGVSLETVREIALTDVDYISVGTLTKDIEAIGLSMRLEPRFGS
jgi:nicotinate-nucleotide pyrophosphorylase (carboxylating)